MGGEEPEEQQRLKRAAAAAYDFEADPRWSEYWSNILIPPHMASRSDVVDHYKRKFFQRFIDPGLVVEPMSTSNASQPARQATSSSSPSNEPPRSRSSGSGTRTSSASSQNPAPLRWDRQTIQFSVSAWIFVLSLLEIFPLVPRSLSNRAYQLSFMGSAGFSAYSLYSLYGRPRAWNTQAIQLWLQSVIATKDFIFLFYSLMFATSNLSLKLALVPVLCRTLEHVAKFLRRNFSGSTLYRKYFEELCVWVASNSSTLNILSSHAEVGLGFLLILSLFSWQRNIILTFIYWQLLKLMYHAPVTAGYHQSVWAKIGTTVTPALNRYAPFLSTPLSVVQGWWYR